MEMEICVKPVLTWSGNTDLPTDRKATSCKNFKIEWLAGRVLVYALDPISKTYTMQHSLTTLQTMQIIKLANASVNYRGSWIRKSEWPRSERWYVERIDAWMVKDERESPQFSTLVEAKKWIDEEKALAEIERKEEEALAKEEEAFAKEERLAAAEYDYA